MVEAARRLVVSGIMVAVIGFGAEASTVQVLSYHTIQHDRLHGHYGPEA